MLKSELTENSIKPSAGPTKLENNENVQVEHFDSRKDVMNEERLESSGERDVTHTENAEFATVPDQSLEREISQREILRLKLEVQRLASRQKYKDKDRELANLRRDMKEKEQTFIELLDELDHANMNNEDLVYHIDTLEKKLKDSEESNEELQFQLDELSIMMDNLEKTAHLEKKEHDYSYLREKLELLQGCLKLSKGRERMLELRIEGLEDNCTTSRNYNFKITAKVSNRELIETKATSELQASVHDATTESKHREAVRRLENEMENLQLKLTENNDLLTNMEAQFMLRQSLFEEELQNAEILFNQKNCSLQETETKLQVLTLAFANTEKKHQDTIEQLQGERERLQMLLTDQSNTLEQKERELQVLTSSLACAKQSHEHGMKQKQIDLERMQRCLNEKTHVLEETQKNLMAVSATVDEIRKEAVVKLQEELNSTQSALGDKEQTLMRIENKGIVQQLENDLKRLQELLREKQLELDKMEVNLQLKESKLLVLTEELRSTQREFGYGDS